MIALLSAAGVSRALLYAAGHEGLLQQPGPDAAAGPGSIDEALGRLASASLLTFSVDDTVAAHRLTMRVARERQAENGSLATLGAGVAGLLSLVTQSQSLVEPWRNRPAARDAVQQIMALHEHLNEQGPAAAGILLQQRKWAIWCLNELGGSFAQAIEYGQPLVADSEQALGDTHLDTLTTCNSLARAYLAAGRLDEAIDLFKRTLTHRKQFLGDTDPDTLTTRYHLARAYRAAGRLDEAIDLFERTLADREQVLGAIHRDTLKSGNSLGYAYRLAWRLDEAIPLLERTLADGERVLGDTDPDTLAFSKQPRGRLQGRQAVRRGHPAPEAHPCPPRAGPGGYLPRHPDLPQQPRCHVPGRRVAGRGHRSVRAHPRRPRAGPGACSPRHPNDARPPGSDLSDRRAAG